MNLKDILLQNLEEDIKNVIDLEDHSEAEIQAEIDSYIVTNNLGNYYSKFADTYLSNIKESGVWISGFYGSGKSYFGKMLGYLLANQSINGTPFADRFYPRMVGIENEVLIKNSLGPLQRSKSLVVFLDIAKQNTTNGLSYTLFKNFLKTLGFLDNEYGFIEYELFIEGEYDNFISKVKGATGKEWKEVRNNVLNIEPGIKKALIGWKYSEVEYNNTLLLVRNIIKDFSSSKLRDMISQYLEIKKDEKIVFMFDETSEAISQNKFTLLDLEGLSESLSSLGNRVWTIAIAQEKIDDVINNANIKKAQLTKVTDRFKTKIHLEATEVDEIIRHRLLKKKDAAFKDLVKHYESHAGQISDLTGLNAPGIEKTSDGETFATYYPFHKYQFTLLQNFLFGTKGLASSKVAARGMIITTFDVLRRQMIKEKLFNMATASALCSEAQPQPPARLVNRYDNAKQILNNEKFTIDGRKLLETIHFLSEAETVPVTLENITKSCISNAGDYHKSYEEIKSALEILVRSKILLVSNNMYKITSDLEQQLLDEMNSFTVELFVKRKYLIDVLKKNSSIKDTAKVQLNGQSYDFYVTTDQDDEIVGSSNKNIRLTYFNIYNVDGNDNTFIEKEKARTASEIGNVTIIPSTDEFKIIDNCIVNIKQISFLEDKHGSSSDDDIKKIIRDFQSRRDEHERRLGQLIDESYRNSVLINLNTIHKTNVGTFKTDIYNRQSKVVQNIYNRSLKSQLGDDIAERVIKESNATRLHMYYKNKGDDFQYFDSAGNFIGESFQVSGDILLKIKNAYVEGKTIESDLLAPPTGYQYGTIASTMAALFRAGKVIAKFNGDEKFSYTDPDVVSIFQNSRNFGKASFKAVSRVLTADQKKTIVEALLDIKYKELMGQAIDYSTNDFELANGIKKLAEKFINGVDAHRKTVKEFDILFKNIQNERDVLATFTGTVTDSNYIDRSESFITNIAAYKNAIKSIAKAETFLRNNLDKINVFRKFAEDVRLEYDKCDTVPSSFDLNYKEFKNIIDDDVVAKFAEIQNCIQKIKDEYYSLITESSNEMTRLHKELKVKAEELVVEINKYPVEPNADVLSRAQKLADYASKRINKDVKIEYDVKCSNCGLTLSEMKAAIALIPNYTNSILFIKSEIVKDAKKPKKKSNKKIHFSMPPRIMKAGEYKTWIAGCSEAIKDIPDDEEIEIEYKG